MFFNIDLVSIHELMFYGIRTNLEQEYWNISSLELNYFRVSNPTKFFVFYVDDQLQEVEDNALDELG